MQSRTPERSNITELLHEWSEGRTEALDELLPKVYDELHRRASAYLKHERPGHTLQTTALVHEAYLKLVDQRAVSGWNDRGHFFAVASQAMRRILVDYARQRHREKRGGVDEALPLEEALLAVADEADLDLVALDEALNRLAEIDPDQEKLVELRYFAGLSLDDAASALGVSRATAAREWQTAKAWLRRELTR
jgi:RNA polymerase sigma factor (TIGR02999 family)